ncbi:lytic polysaccharide monooxygenase [Aulographum hederae CBS 113979]|uniref:lytic cellulose monooxygenase (C4-dehydrogenating) n=1 Tax=Aulographum hederae CBS 113979 TaxID=1176131 RepID=A0A6G1GM30_9PEZI|nr:lytic polysaccharide monooxygenase [Aulographum hederae CBS 113979]
MKSTLSALLFAAGAAAHSAVWTINFDGTEYPALDARMDKDLGAKRIEWTFTNNNGVEGRPAPWQAITDVTSPGITCGLEPKYPALRAVARAGTDIVVNWSGMIRMHYGPVLSYLGAIPTPDTKAQGIKFFKVKGDGYDKAANKWANEYVLDNNRTDVVKIPSNIKPGMYVFRTELLALHGNGLPAPLGGPQFYTHCFNVNITGNGADTPEGVTFPGGYKPDEKGVAFTIMNKAIWGDYTSPGPALYEGKHDAPVGDSPVVYVKDTGIFPEEFQKKYEAIKEKEDAYSLAANDKFNSLNNPGPGQPRGDMTEFATFLAGHVKEGEKLQQELEALKKEAVELGLATPQ